MSINNYIPYEGDLAFAYVVQPADWNGMFDTLATYINGTLVPAINSLSTANIGAVQNLFQARLTLTTGVPVTGLDVTAATSLYLTNYFGNSIGIYAPLTQTWNGYSFSSDLSLAVPTGNWDLFDFYVYWNGTNLALLSESYPTVIATNNPSAGVAVTINVSSTSLFQSGDVIGVTGGGNGESAVITTIVTNTSITVEQLSYSYTTPTLHCARPTNGFTLTNGIPLLTADLGKRYVGTALVVNNTIDDSTFKRNLANYNNRSPRNVAVVSSGTISQSASSTVGYIGATKTLGQTWASFVMPFGLIIPMQVSSALNFQNTVGNSITTTMNVDSLNYVTPANYQVSNFQTNSATSEYSPQQVLNIRTGGRHILSPQLVSSSGGNYAANSTFQGLINI